MQTLYGVRCTDRITVVSYSVGLTSGVFDRYSAHFDGQLIGNDYTSGRAAVNAAIDWLRARAKQREIDAEQAETEAADRQRLDDRRFIDELAYDLKIDNSRIDELLEIAIRRAKEV